MSSNDLSTAIQAARAAHAALEHLQASKAVTKLDEPVTVADYTSQAIINHTLRAQFPQDAILAEERAEHFTTLLTAAQRNHITAAVAHSLGASLTPDDVARMVSPPEPSQPSGRTWIIDPIDGTKGYIAGRSFAIAIALQAAEGELVLGVLAAPRLPDGADRLFFAQRGQGAFRQTLAEPDTTPEPIQASPVAATTLLLTSYEAKHSDKDLFNGVRERLSGAYTVDSLGMDGQGKYGLVASGQASAYFRLVPAAHYREKVWDHAAGVVIVETAGGTVTDFEGKPLDFRQGPRLENNRGIVVSNGALHPDLLAAIRAATPPGDA
ncbi:MAG: inositol monophosphatase family protein [Anaerolineales bacterium]